MPKIIEIAEGGATDEQLDAVVDHFISLRVSRDRQPALVFDDDNNPTSCRRTTNGEFLFGAIQVKDRDGLRTLLSSMLTRKGRVVIGMVEGSAAREDRTEENPRGRSLRRSNRR